jgi:hypothetical protein
MANELFKVGPNIVDNQDITIETDGNGDLNITHKQTSGNLRYNSTSDAWVMNNGIDLEGGLLTDSTQGYIDLDDGNDLRLSTGSSIEDGSGTSRIELFSGNTFIKDENGAAAFRADGGQYRRIYANSDEPFDIFDGEGGYTAVQYDTDTNAGVLRTSNAGLAVQDVKVPSSGSGTAINHVNGDRGLVQSYSEFGTSTFQRLDVEGSEVNLRSKDGTVNLSRDPANLRIATGQAIEDGSGNQRLSLQSVGTFLRRPDQSAAFGAEDNRIRVYTDSTHPFQVRDQEGAFNAVQYTTSANAPGTLELTNANLDTNGNPILIGGTLSDGGDHINFGNRLSPTSVPPTGETTLYAIDGELRAQDDDGNQTILT